MMFRYAAICAAWVAVGGGAFAQQDLAAARGVNSARLASVSGEVNGLAWTDGVRQRLLVSPDYACYFSAISDDGNRVAFKDFLEAGRDTRLQIPCVYLANLDRVVALCPAAAQVGNPALGADGKVAFAVGNVLNIVELNDAGDAEVLAVCDLGFMANTCTLTPDGVAVVATDSESGRVVRVNIADGAKEEIANVQGAYAPIVSPDGAKLAVQVVTGQIAIGELPEAGMAKMSVPKFTFIEPQDETVMGDIWWDDSSNLSYTLTREIKRDLRVSKERVGVRLERGSDITTRSLSMQEVDVPQRAAVYDAGSAQVESSSIPEKHNGVITNGNDVLLDGDIPYIHQYYDCLNTFPKGGSACNATSALIAIQYYSRLPKMPRTVTTGGSHTSNWGFYISEIYTYGTKTFNIVSTNVWSGCAGYYGGFGYFLQDATGDSYKRRARLSEFIGHHGITSSVDNNTPTIAKARTEVDNEYPAPILCDLTSSGHYVVVTGYVKNQNTLIFHDPYGNKNNTYTNKNGVRARYDWPGSNNGYQNLTKVHCFIYARSANPTAIAVTAAAQTINRGATMQLTATGTMNKGGTKNLTPEPNITWAVTAGADIASVSTTGVVIVSGLASSTKEVRVTATFQNIVSPAIVLQIPTASVEDWLKQ